MKTANILFTAVVLLVGSFGFSQAKISEHKNVEVNGIGISVTELADLKTINWDDIFEIFNEQREDSKISLFVELKDIDATNKDNEEVHFTKVKYEVSGLKSESKNLRKQMVLITKRILKNYKS
jgi:hypothetical protein